MELTGKCKQDFEKWFQAKSETHYRLVEWFESLDLAMQWGVLQDFFDKQNIFVLVDYCAFEFKPYEASVYINLDMRFQEDYESRLEARTAAIKKANKIYNHARPPQQ